MATRKVTPAALIATDYAAIALAASDTITATDAGKVDAKALHDATIAKLQINQRDSLALVFAPLPKLTRELYAANIAVPFKAALIAAGRTTGGADVMAVYVEKLALAVTNGIPLPVGVVSLRDTADSLMAALIAAELWTSRQKAKAKPESDAPTKAKLKGEASKAMDSLRKVDATALRAVAIDALASAGNDGELVALAASIPAPMIPAAIAMLRTLIATK